MNINTDPKEAALAEMLINRVQKNQRRFKAWLKKNNVSCYRLYNRDIPEIPLQIDWYEGRLHVAMLARDGMDSEEQIERWSASLIAPLAAVLSVSMEDVFVKVRRKGPGGTQYGHMKDDRRVFEVSEGGHRFFVNLSDYMDTGLFLDHRITRAMVQADAKGRRVLNLFSYTGSFSVYAAAGGAESTTTVDMSNTWLDFAEANMALNGFEGENHRFVRDDILQALEDRRVDKKFDLVVFDPPTISRSAMMKQSLEIQRDHVWMLNRILDILVPGGLIYFSNNLKNFKMSAEAIRASRIDDITERTVPPDFASRRPHMCFRIEK